MRILTTVFALVLGLASLSASADQKLLTGILDEGAIITDVEAEATKNAQSGIFSGGQELIDQVSALVAAHATEDENVLAILRGAAKAYPDLAEKFAEASIAAAPEAAAVIAAYMLETVPTAAGPGEGTTFTLDVIPVPAGGGNVVASPN